MRLRPTDCMWGQWEMWGACDKCGGQRKRFRRVLWQEQDEQGLESERLLVVHTHTAHTHIHIYIYMHTGYVHRILLIYDDVTSFPLPSQILFTVEACGQTAGELSETP